MTRYLIADFTLFTGTIAGVGYNLIYPDLTPNGPRITAGITQPVTGLRIYAANVTLPTLFSGSIVWDTGGPTPGFSIAAINPSNVGAISDSPQAAANLAADESQPVQPVVLLPGGTAQGIPTTTVIAIQGPTLVPVTGVYASRRLYYNGILTDPCLLHTVVGTDSLAIHTFTFTLPQKVAPAAGASIQIGGY